MGEMEDSNSTLESFGIQTLFSIYFSVYILLNPIAYIIMSSNTKLSTGSPIVKQSMVR